MCAPKTPVGTGLPSRSVTFATNVSNSGFAMSGGAARDHDGRFPFRVDACSVNWETARIEPRTDMAAAMKFYEQVFGWQPSESMDMGHMGKYQMFNRPHGMIGGIMNKPPEMANVPPYWLIYFRVPDVDAATERIKANGGKIVNGPMEVPGGDRVVLATDPQGAAFGLHSKKA